MDDLKKGIISFPLPRIEQRKSGRPARALDIIAIKLSQLPYYGVSNAELLISSLVRAFRKNTTNINQQMHLYDFHLKHFKTLKTTPTCFDLFRSSPGSFVVPC